MQSFIEKNFIAITHSKENGYALMTPWFILGTPTTFIENVPYRLTLLSFYEFSTRRFNHAKGKEPVRTTIWLLKLIMGNYITKETKTREEFVRLNNHDYIVTQYLRSEGYFTLRYLFPRLNKKTNVYLVSSSTDKELHDSTFFLREWVEDQRRPSTNEVINQAKKIYKLVESFKL